ncbi:MAG: FAD:protein FMN transferase [Cyclobacteriaceae bacterium]|jgi:thiamine biosynthesis lipoprotein|nr:FAD:protein FMN transferase [Cyclobacteriaceae bacterium]
MSARVKNIVYTLVLLTLTLGVWWYRNQNKPNLILLSGATMGTTYHVSYFDEKGRNFQQAVDSLLVLVNKAINNYDTTSEVSVFNKSERVYHSQSVYFLPAILIGKEVYLQSNGAFDMTVMPLVNAWGFGPNKNISPDSVTIDSLQHFVGFDKVNINQDSLIKLDARVQLDFGGIGQGYGADVIAEFLNKKGITNYLVELGGEGLAKGKNLESGKPWEIGILDPNSTRDNQFFKAYASLQDKAFTTSGSYFNYRVIDGKKYAHTLHPKTGYPVESNLLSVTVFAENCTLADAWATAFMVSGVDKTKELLTQHPELDVLLLYTGSDGSLQSFVSDNIKNYVTLNP